MSQLSLKKIKLGDNADLSKNFVISVPAVADGTLTIERENGTDVLTIDSAGNIRAGSSCNLAGNGPAFSAQLTGNQTVVSGATTKLQFASENYDTANCYDSTTNFRFTPNTPGYYQINVVAQAQGTSIGSVVVALYKNGASICNAISATSTVPFTSSSLSDLVYLNGSTDYLEVYGQINATSPRFTFGVDTKVSGFLARAA